MTRCVEDAALLFQAIAGPDPRDSTTFDGSPFEIPPFSGDIKGMRLGIPRDWCYDEIDSEVAEAVSEATDHLKGMGASLVEFGFLDVFSGTGTISFTEKTQPE